MGEIKDKTINTFIVAIALFFPFALILLVFPLNIFVRNHAELYNDIVPLEPILTSALVTGAICCIIGAFLSFKKLKARWTISAFFLYLGLYILFSDLVAPVSFDKHIGFDGRENILSPSATDISLDIFLSVIFAILFYRFRSPNFVKIGATFAFVFLAVNITGDLQESRAAALAAPPVTLKKEWVVVSPAPDFAADHPNVYHVMLDGFQSSVFPDAMKRLGVTAKDFDGFIHFPKNRSNYDGTQMSVPSFFSGSIYKDGSLKDWITEWSRSGIWRRIREKFNTNIQVYSGMGDFYRTSGINLDRNRINRVRVEGFSNIIFHISLAKASPSYFHKYIFSNGRGIFSLYKKKARDREREFYTNISARLKPFYLLIKDERLRPSRGQYVYAHIFLPHSPYMHDADCRVYKDRPNLPEFYKQNATCALRYVKKFLDTLRLLGRYKDSAIVIHADHGWVEGEPIEPLTGTREEARMQEVDLVGKTPRAAIELDKFTSPLLMVKPPGISGVPMVVSKKSTQLVDIPNTLYDMLSMDIKAPEGMSVLSEDYPDSVERHVYPGFRRWDRKANKQIWVGKEVLKGELNHFSWTSGKGWKVYPNMPFSWE